MAEGGNRGLYVCQGCSSPLYSTDDKVALPDPTIGWAVFEKPFSTTSVETRADFTLGMKRTALHCHKCGAALGHLFKDAGALERHTISPASLKLLDPKDVHLRKRSDSLPTQDNIFLHSAQAQKSSPQGLAIAVAPFAAMIFGAVAKAYLS